MSVRTTPRIKKATSLEERREAYTKFVKNAGDNRLNRELSIEELNVLLGKS